MRNQKGKGYLSSFSKGNGKMQWISCIRWRFLILPLVLSFLSEWKHMGQCNLGAFRKPATQKIFRCRCGTEVLSPDYTLKSPGGLLICTNAAPHLYIFWLSYSGMDTWHWSHIDLCVCVYLSIFICGYTHIQMDVCMHICIILHYFIQSCHSLCHIFVSIYIHVYTETMMAIYLDQNSEPFVLSFS